VIALTVRQSRRALLGWLLGITAMTALYAASYKSIAGAKAAAISGYPDALKRALNLSDLASAPGYLASTVFGIPLMLLLSIYVIGSATRAIAGDEETGALDLLLSYPLSRRVLVMARMATISGIVSVMGVVVFTAVAAVRTPAGLGIGIANVAATTVTWVLLGWCLAGIALLISASSGRRSATLGLSAAVALFAYLADSFLPLIDHLNWIRNISPYYWFTGGNPLQNGLQIVHCTLLIVTALVATALAVVAFDRRDLRV
jgi:ABC-2 type transport system permease protein